MLRSDKINRICCICLVVMLVLTTMLWGVIEANGSDRGTYSMGYEDRLFDQSYVHEIYITASDWETMIQNAANEEYIVCDAVIDGEKYNNLAIRPKGNTSLSSVQTLGSERYSFKIEFDHFDKNTSYHGLDKLSLNNMIQDATAMKDYLAYTLMNRMGVPAPLCSYSRIYVNGEYWGLYLAVEGVEDSYLTRNEMGKGELYKPDSLSFGGGRGNGGGFDINNFRVDEEETAADTGTAADAGNSNDFSSSFGGSASSGSDFSPSSGMPTPGGDMPSFSFDAASTGTMTPPDNAGDFDISSIMGGFNFGMGSDDVKLVYTDDEFSSYSNIFNNAKTDVNNADKTRLIASLKKLNEGDTSVVNTEEVTRYLAVHSFLCNDDSYTGMMVHNYYLYEENGVLTIIPWDYNLGFGGFSAGTNATSTVNTSIDSPVTGGTTSSRPLIAWIFNDEEALEHYHEIYNEFLTGCLENGWLSSEIDRVWNMIEPCLENDPTRFYNMEEFELGVSTIRTFCEKRAQSIRNQLDGTNETVDASDIATADMGSMNSTNGGGMTMPGTSGFDRNSFGFGEGNVPSTGADSKADSDVISSASAVIENAATAEPAAAATAEPAATATAAAADFGVSAGTAAGVPDMTGSSGNAADVSGSDGNASQIAGMTPPAGDASGMPDVSGFTASDGNQAVPAATAEPTAEPVATATAATADFGASAGTAAGVPDMTGSSGNAADMTPPAGGTSGMPDMSGFTGSDGSQTAPSATDAADAVSSASAVTETTSSPEPSATAEAAASEEPAVTEAAAAPGGQGKAAPSMPADGKGMDMSSFGGSMPGDFSGSVQSGYPVSTWIWLGVLSVLLISAILIIKRASGHN